MNELIQKFELVKRQIIEEKKTEILVKWKNYEQKIEELLAYGEKTIEKYKDIQDSTEEEETEEEFKKRNKYKNFKHRQLLNELPEIIELCEAKLEKQSYTQEILKKTN